MKRILLNSSIILGIHLILICATNFVKPFYFENATFRGKVENLSKECPTCNAFFIGSSLTFQQVNPMLFDSLVNLNERHPKIKSYNLGSRQVTLLEALYLSENSIKEKIIPANSTLFVELRPHTSMDSLFTAKNTFYRGFGDLELVTAPKESLLLRASTMYRSFAQYFFNYINGGMLSTLNKNFVIEQLDEEGIRGFLPLKTSSTSRDKFILIDHGRIEYDWDQIDMILEKLRHVNEIANKHQIRLIYLVPNLLFEESSIWKTHLIYTLDKDPTLEIIDMGQPKLYPELFDPDLYYDIRHLNEDGANLYTRYLADAYLDLE